MQSHLESARVSQYLAYSARDLERFSALADFWGPQIFLGGNWFKINTLAANLSNETNVSFHDNISEQVTKYDQFF